MTVALCKAKSAAYEAEKHFEKASAETDVDERMMFELGARCSHFESKLHEQEADRLASLPSKGQSLMSERPENEDDVDRLAGQLAKAQLAESGDQIGGLQVASASVEAETEP